MRDFQSSQGDTNYRVANQSRSCRAPFRIPEGYSTHPRHPEEHRARARYRCSIGSCGRCRLSMPHLMKTGLRTAPLACCCPPCSLCHRLLVVMTLKTFRVQKLPKFVFYKRVARKIGQAQPFLRPSHCENGCCSTALLLSSPGSWRSPPCRPIPCFAVFRHARLGWMLVVALITPKTPSSEISSNPAKKKLQLAETIGLGA